MDTDSDGEGRTADAQQELNKILEGSQSTLERVPVVGNSSGRVNMRVKRKAGREPTLTSKIVRHALARAIVSREFSMRVTTKGKQGKGSGLYV